MKIRLDWRRSAQENAAKLFELSKELAKKGKGAANALKETQAELEKQEKHIARQNEIDTGPVMKRKRQWFEKYRWFYTSGKRLVVAGRDAKQNDLLVARVMDEQDLFFHADIQGAPATILKDGKKANEKEKKEAAGFAASHSSAWKTGAAAVDVYCVSKDQLSKHAQGGYIGAGGFAIKGKREWFKSTRLGLALGKVDEIVVCLPVSHSKAKEMQLVLPGNMEKGKAAKEIAKLLGAQVDEVLLALPAGKFSLKGK